MTSPVILNPAVPPAQAPATQRLPQSGGANGGKWLVVPTNRPASLARFLQEWRGRGGWNYVVVVEDSPSKSEEVDKAADDAAFYTSAEKVWHYSHAEIAAELGADAWVISKGSSACRSFGFLKAWWEGASYVLTLDDDCYPDHRGDHNFFDLHIAATSGGHRWASSVRLNDGLELNVRGMPVNRGCLPHTCMNLGLWSGVPDLSARDQLDYPTKDFKPGKGNWLVPHNQYVPVSGMNLCVARQAIPLMYFAPMGNGQPYHRFDDIWMGVIAKKVCDLLGWQISVGEPFVRHERASDPHKNLELEAPGLEENERFWKRIDRFQSPGSSSLKDMKAIQAMADVGHYLREHADEWNWPYAYHYGQALGVWCRLLANGPGPTSMTHTIHRKEANRD